MQLTTYFADNHCPPGWKVAGDHCVYLSVNITSTNITVNEMCAGVGASFYAPATQTELTDLMNQLPNGEYQKPKQSTLTS